MIYLCLSLLLLFLRFFKVSLCFIAFSLLFFTFFTDFYVFFTFLLCFYDFFSYFLHFLRYFGLFYRPDVWFVTITQALTWMTDPKPVSQLKSYEPWDCKKRENLVPKPCKIPNKCALAFKRPELNITDTRYLETCNDCPNQYPWLDDATGSGIPGKDNYVPDNVRK